MANQLIDHLRGVFWYPITFVFILKIWGKLGTNKPLEDGQLIN